MQFHGFLQETVIAVVVTKVNEARNRLFMTGTEQKTELRKEKLSLNFQLIKMSMQVKYRAQQVSNIQATSDSFTVPKTSLFCNIIGPDLHGLVWFQERVVFYLSKTAKRG